MGIVRRAFPKSIAWHETRRWIGARQALRKEDSGEANRRYMVWVPHASVEVTRQFIGWCMGAWDSGSVFPYMLVRKSDAQVLGMLDARATDHGLNIGYVLAREHWGQGYVPEAVRGLAEIALSRPTVFRIEATCDVENHPSARVLEKSGFVREGRLARYTVHPNLSPEPRDCWMYARLR